MKKLYSLLCLILIAILALSMVSCNNKENDEDPEGDPGTGGYTAASTQIRAIDFEDYLYTVTDVVIGKCQRAECSNGYYYYDFDVTESLRGKGTDSKITIEMLNTDFVMTDLDESADNKRFSTKDLKYETGKSYLLLLKRVDSVYNASETLYFAASTLVLPMEALNDSSRSDELKLYNTKLKDRVKDEETLKAIDEGRFTQRILELVKDNPTVSGTKYLKETDLATVIEKSDYVFKITIKND